jgi:hypothetical protein
MVSSVNPYNLDSYAIPPQSSKAGEFERGVHERIQYANVEAKKLTATMKRRALKLKSIEILPTKARNPKARALVVSAPQPSGM